MLVFFGYMPIEVEGTSLEFVFKNSKFMNCFNFLTKLQYYENVFAAFTHFFYVTQIDLRFSHNFFQISQIALPFGKLWLRLRQFILA